MIWIDLFKLLITYVVRVFLVVFVVFLAYFLMLYAVPYTWKQIDVANELQTLHDNKSRLEEDEVQSQAACRQKETFLKSITPNRPDIFTWPWPILARVSYDWVEGQSNAVKRAMLDLTREKSNLRQIRSKKVANQSEIARLETGPAKLMASLLATYQYSRDSIIAIVAAVFIGPFMWRVIRYLIAKKLLPKCQPIRLHQPSSGTSVECSASTRGLSVPIAPDMALISRPEWVEESDERVTLQNRFFWKLSSPGISYAAGMAPCTRITVNKVQSLADATIRLTSGKQNDYITSVHLTEGQAVCLRPAYIVAVTEGIRIRSCWRIANLHSWLSGQVRYLIFSGPGTLYVCGAGGIEASKVEHDKKLASDCLIGFDPCLSYSAAPANGFVPYFLGKVPLLQSQFHGSGNVIRLFTSDKQSDSVLKRATGSVLSALGNFFGF